MLPSSNFAYGYDAVGNRLTKTTGANNDTYTYSASSNRIATLTPFGSPARNFVFDANGSSTNDGLNTYAYDPRGRMVSATNGSSLVTSYQVNALGQRIRKTNANEDRVFTYDTWGKRDRNFLPSVAAQIERQWPDRGCGAVDGCHNRSCARRRGSHARGVMANTAALWRVQASSGRARTASAAWSGLRRCRGRRRR